MSYLKIRPVRTILDVLPEAQGLFNLRGICEITVF
jgi:hypothetical protein